MRKSEKPVEDVTVIINGWARTAGNAPRTLSELRFAVVLFIVFVWSSHPLRLL